MKYYYWINYCSQCKHEKNSWDSSHYEKSWINGELFTAILDRLRYEGIDISEVLNNLDNISNKLKNRNKELDLDIKEMLHKDSYSSEDIEYLIQINNTKKKVENICRYTSILKNPTIEDYKILKELSKCVYSEIESIIYNEILKNSITTSDIDNLKNSIFNLKEDFKQSIIDSRMDYFETNNNKRAIHLGYKVYCLEFLERFLKCEFVLDLSDLHEYKDINFSKDKYSELLDWNGDLENLLEGYPIQDKEYESIIN